jgi:ATP-dependent Zn protease
LNFSIRKVMRSVDASDSSGSLSFATSVYVPTPKVTEEVRLAAAAAGDPVASKSATATAANSAGTHAVRNGERVAESLIPAAFFMPSLRPGVKRV